jgi:hypothetical protein
MSSEFSSGAGFRPPGRSATAGVLVIITTEGSTFSATLWNAFDSDFAYSDGGSAVFAGLVG